MTGFEPAYRRLLREGGFPERVRQAQAALTDCNLCAWQCGIDRTQVMGVCRTGTRAAVASAFPHMGEEAPLTGRHGSGTIFFARCNMHCQFCQNHDISQADAGEPVEPEQLAGLMLRLQAMGCHNVNFVSPSHVIAPIIAAVEIAAQAGLSIPLVYNTGGYDSLAGLALLDGIIDIYMPDMKYGDSAIAHRYSHVRNYWEVNRAAVKEMHRQVGDLRLDENGLAYRGLLVRHLVLPAGLAGTAKVLEFIAREISTETYLNLMGQYYPCYRASERPELARPITAAEYREALDIARRLGLTRQDRSSRRRDLL